MIYDDAGIRAHLKAGLRQILGEEALIIDELGIHGGRIRADVTVLLPDRIVGYEIKSDKDTLARLPNQVKYYSKLFDRCYLITGEKYANKAIPLTRHWWGIYTIKPDWVDPNFPLFELERRPKDNPKPQDWALARLLWRDEVLAILREMGLARGLSGANKRVLYAKLLASTERPQLLEWVYEALSTRQGWRPE